jgi:hypothetical protein
VQFHLGVLFIFFRFRSQPSREAKPKEERPDGSCRWLVCAGDELFLDMFQWPNMYVPSSFSNMEFCIFYGPLVYFTAIWYLWPFGICSLGQFPVLVCCNKKIWQPWSIGRSESGSWGRPRRPTPGPGPTSSATSGARPSSPGRTRGRRVGSRSWRRSAEGAGRPRCGVVETMSQYYDSELQRQRCKILQLKQQPSAF